MKRVSIAVLLTAVVAVALVISVGEEWRRPHRTYKASAQPAKQECPAVSVLTVPSDYRLVSVTDTMLVFERKGEIRIARLAEFGLALKTGGRWGSVIGGGCLWLIIERGAPSIS